MIKDSSKTKGDDKSNMLADTLGRLNSISSQFHEHFLSSWQGTHETRLKGFVEVEASCLKRLNQLVAGGSPSPSFWQELETALQKFSELTGSLEYIEKDFSPMGLWGDWRNDVDEVIKSLPASSRKNIPKKYWEPNPEDTLKARLWKQYKESQTALVEFIFKMINKSRGLFGRPALRLPRLSRKITVRSFFEYYYMLPTADFFLQTWQRLLHQIVVQLCEVHAITETMMDELLHLDDSKEVCFQPTPENKIPKLEKVKKQSRTLNSFCKEFDRFKDEERKRFEGFIIELGDAMEQGWEFAGTFMLPNKKFAAKKSTDKWSRLEAEFDRNKNAWNKHFDGEAEDWNKDLELSQIQSQITQICVETLDSLNKKMSEQILPSFREPLGILSNSLEKFRGINIKQEEELKDEILTRNRLMLRSLRKEKLPRTVDALVQAQLLKTLNSYLGRTKHNLEQLPEHHTIFRFQDLQGLPPESKLVDIPLKNLVLEEVYMDQAKGFENFTSEIQKKLDNIVRDISEIDQIVEFNLEGALELLEEGDDLDVLQEARNVVIKGLERAKSQLDLLVDQNQKIAEASTEALLQTTVEFQKQIQELGDNEKIIALKLRAAKAKTQEELRDYRRKILNAIKSAAPSLLAFLTSFSQKIRSRYLKLRKMTGLAPVSTDVEEKLSQFITHTQKQIASLPYVYQHLFRIQPLSDERFFEGRDDDLALLRQQFDLWKAGQYGVTALVGEKGGGKTTLLNFATTQIYSKLPIKKIELTDTQVRTEESLFEFLKHAFHDKEAASLEELENIFIEKGNQKVVIVEDIQNLFLRTVDSFEALERFLLFVSRTHGKIYWVITCTLYSWRYLDKVVKVSKFFQRVIFLGGLTREDIESIVLKRHRVSGYKLLFEATDELVNSKKFKKLTTDESRQEFLRNIYFKELNGLALGNISVTMLSWLSAISRIEEDTIVVLAGMNLDFSFLHQLPDDEIFTLAALLQHEMMSLEEHALVFRQSHRQSLLLLNRMTNRGILYKKSNDNYQINFLLYRAVVQTLSVKNILH